MFQGKKVAVVVPAYNEEKLIVPTLQGIPSFVDKIYVTDDCSQDNTALMIEKQARKDKRVVLIQHAKNQGVGGAIVSGFKRALKDGIEIVSIMAGDNQMRPEHLPTLLEPLVQKKTDFTKGNRLKVGYWKGMSLFRLFGNFVLTVLNKAVTGYWTISDPQNGYVGLSCDALEKMDLDTLYKGYAFENDIMVKANVANIRMRNVPIPAYYGEEQSKIKYGRFIIRTSSHLFKSYFWRIWNKYIKKLHFVGLLAILGILLLIGGVTAGIIMNFSSLLYILLPIGGAVLLLLSAIADVLIGIRLGKERKEKKK